jgi:hypothetical protein
VAQDEVAGSLWLACAATGPDPELGAWCGDHLRRIAPPTSVRLRWGTGGAVIAYDQLALEVTGGTPELNRTVAAHLAFHLVQDQQLALRGAATLTLHTEGGRVRELAQEGTPLGLGDAPRSWVVGGGPSASTTLQVTLRDP